MTSWNGRTKDGTYGVAVEAAQLLALERMCNAAGSVETGGVLIGRYSDDRAVAWVKEVTPAPADSARGASWFVRGVAGLRATLARRWKAKERTYYLGEWHFHPAPIVVPSKDDFRQMRQISAADAYRCSEPLLLILGAAGKRGGKRSIRAFVCPVGREPSELLCDAEVSGDQSQAVGA